MKNSFAKRFKKVFIYYLIGFLVLFVFRIIYGYTIKVEDHQNNFNYNENFSSLKRNIASKKYKVQTGNQASVNVDQKYEKIADIKTKSADFDNEEKTARTAIKFTKGIIQFE